MPRPADPQRSIYSSTSHSVPGAGTAVGLLLATAVAVLSIWQLQSVRPAAFESVATTDHSRTTQSTDTVAAGSGSRSAVLFLTLALGLALGGCLWSWRRHQQLRQLNRSLLQRLTHLASAREESQSLHQSLQTRTEQLRKSRSAALNMMRDADAARQQAETAAHEQQQQAERMAQINHQLEQQMDESARLQGQLIQASRQNGIAEVTTGILHSVGHVLNSINTSTTLVEDRIKTSRTMKLRRAADLLNTHRDDLADFLTYDLRGQCLPDYVCGVAQSLQEDQQFLVSELNELKNHLTHIRQIIEIQQSNACPEPVLEMTSLREVIQSALRANRASLETHSIAVTCQLTDGAPLLTDRNKVLQILINLIDNARSGIAAYPAAGPGIDIQLDQPDEDHWRIRVSDAGCGIAGEQLEQIFEYGFAADKDGYGFSLHSSRVTADAIGGSLFAESDGPGCGATLTLQLPVETAPRNTQSDEHLPVAPPAEVC